MLIDFTVGNYLSFKDKKTLSLEATKITEYPDSTFESPAGRLLKSCVVYGANSSGKSNLIKAMSTMRTMVLYSVDKFSIIEADITPFLLHSDTEKEPSFFEVTFLINDNQYRYGFELDQDRIHEEWLFVLNGDEETPLFLRDKEGIGLGEGFEEGESLEDKTRDSALFLTVVDQFNGKEATQILNWFESWDTISGVNHKDYRKETVSLLKDEKHKETLINFYKTLDLGFDELELKETHRLTLFPPIDKQLYTFHKKYNPANNTFTPKQFSLEEQESSGTNKLIDLSGPIFTVLLKGGILIVDELDAKLHPLITKAIVHLFNSKESNPNNAQLIFATHDTNLLSYGQFRRDQIYFVEKDPYEASDLYSLIEYRENDSDKPVRKDRSFEKDYIHGRYGAIPFIGNLNDLLKHG